MIHGFHERRTSQRCRGIPNSCCDFCSMFRKQRSGARAARTRVEQAWSRSERYFVRRVIRVTAATGGADSFPEFFKRYSEQRSCCCPGKATTVPNDKTHDSSRCTLFGAVRSTDDPSRLTSARSNGFRTFGLPNATRKRGFRSIFPISKTE